MISGQISASEARRAVGRLLQALASAGIDVRRFGSALRALPGFVAERRSYRSNGTPLDPPLQGLLPMLADRGEDAGTVDAYFLQDLWMARQVRDAAPQVHVDVGSRIDGFVAHVLMFTEVEVIDVRPLTLDIPGLRSRVGDGRYLESLADGSVASLSSLHAIEHFGLGRYGDPLDPDGSAKALDSFSRVLAPGGRLYLAVPVGRSRTQFNAHRVFAPEAIPPALPDLRLVRFAGITDDGRLLEGVHPSTLADERYGVGLFVFERP